VLPAAALRSDVRGDWDEAKQHDVVFLLTIRPPDANELATMRTAGGQVNPMELYGLTYVRGCEVIEVKDEGTPSTGNARLSCAG
jgi:intron-binding protein aquarius